MDLSPVARERPTWSHIASCLRIVEDRNQGTIAAGETHVDVDMTACAVHANLRSSSRSRLDRQRVRSFMNEGSRRIEGESCVHLQHVRLFMN
jgi:hypothetical protein